MVGVPVIVSPKTAGVKLMSVSLMLISLFGVRLSPKLLSRSGSSMYMVMKFSRWELSINVIFCLITLGHTMLYICVMLRSLFSMIVSSPKSRLIVLISVVVNHCNVVINGTGSFMALLIFGVVMELPYAFDPIPMCKRETPTTTLLLYAVAVMGYVPTHAYCITADWLGDLVLVAPFQKSR